MSRPTRRFLDQPWLPSTAVALIVLAIIAAYWRVGDVPFLFDDAPGIERNASIRQLWPLSQALQPPETAAGATGRPVVNLSLAINYAFGQLEPRGYHWTNVALHAGVAILLFGLVRRTLLLPIWAGSQSDNALPAAVTITGIWAIHPLLTESVVCVIQRNELIVSFFYLATLYLLSRSATSRNTVLWQVATVASCALGMASKEVMATAPVLALLYDRTFLAGSFGGAWRARRWLYGGLAATWLILLLLISQHHQRAGIVGFGLGVSSWDYLVSQCGALGTYLKLSIWPHPLIVDYGVDLAPLRQVWGQGLLIVAMLTGTIWALVRKPAIGFLAAAFFVLLAPSSSFVPLTTQPIAEHRMYLPLASLIALAAGALWLFPPSWRRLLSIAFFVIYGGLTVLRVGQYTDDEKLWTDNIAQTPGNARAHASLAAVYVRRGDWEQALGHLAEAARLRPDYADVRSDYANVLLRFGRGEEAVRELTAARRLKPADVDIQYNLGVVLAQVGRVPEATAQLREVTQKSPGHAAAWNNLGDTLLRQGLLLEALEAFERVLALDPSSAAAHNNAGVTLMRLGRPAEAVPHYKATLSRMPASSVVHHNLALALAQSGRFAEAIAHEEEALRLQPNFPAARQHLEQLRQSR